MHQFLDTMVNWKLKCNCLILSMLRLGLSFPLELGLSQAFGVVLFLGLRCRGFGSILGCISWCCLVECVFFYRR
jgi:hypothetical protein